MIRGKRVEGRVLIDELQNLAKSFASIEQTVDLAEMMAPFIEACQYIDEVNRRSLALYRFSLNDDPELTVEVFLIDEDKRNPRHPNPAAGKRKLFRVIHAGKQVGTICHSEAEAVRRAKNKHNALVARHQTEQKEKLQSIPNFGSF